MTARRTHPEQDLHVATAAYLNAVLIPPTMAFHVPNGGSRSRRTNANGQPYSPEGRDFKRMGVRAGMPDWLIVHQGRLYGFELKTPKGSLSSAQKTTFPALEAAGVPGITTCRSLEDVSRTLQWLRIPTREAK